MIKKLLLRNVLLYAVLAFVLAVCVDWQLCFRQRGRYLLGLWYNGHFQNDLDGEIYKDYLKRHGTTPEEFQRSL